MSSSSLFCALIWLASNLSPPPSPHQFPKEDRLPKKVAACPTQEATRPSPPPKGIWTTPTSPHRALGFFWSLGGAPVLYPLPPNAHLLWAGQGLVLATPGPTGWRDKLYGTTAIDGGGQVLRRTQWRVKGKGAPPKCVPFSWDLTPSPQPPDAQRNGPPHLRKRVVTVPRAATTQDVLKLLPKKWKGKSWERRAVLREHLMEIIEHPSQVGVTLDALGATPSRRDPKDSKACSRNQRSQSPWLELWIPRGAHGEPARDTPPLLIQRSSLLVGAQVGWDGGVVWVLHRKGPSKEAYAAVAQARVILITSKKRLLETFTDRSGFARISYSAMRRSHRPLVLLVEKGRHRHFTLLPPLDSGSVASPSNLSWSPGEIGLSNRDAQGTPGSAAPPLCVPVGRLVVDRTQARRGETLHFAAVGRRACLRPSQKPFHRLTDSKHPLYAVLRLRGQVVAQKKVAWRRGDFAWGRLEVPDDVPMGQGHLSLEYLPSPRGEASPPRLRHRAWTSHTTNKSHFAKPDWRPMEARILLAGKKPKLEVTIFPRRQHAALLFKALDIWQHAVEGLRVHYRVTGQASLVTDSKGNRSVPLGEGMACLDPQGEAWASLETKGLLTRFHSLRVEASILLPDGRVLKTEAQESTLTPHGYVVRAPRHLRAGEVGLVEISKEVEPLQRATFRPKQVKVSVWKKEGPAHYPLKKANGFCAPLGFWDEMVCPFYVETPGEFIVAVELTLKTNNPEKEPSIHVTSGRSMQVTRKRSALELVSAQERPRPQDRRSGALPHERFSLSGPKKTMAPGQTATLQVKWPPSWKQSTFPREGILTLHRHGLWRAQRVSFPKNKPTLSIPLYRWQAPEIEATLFVRREGRWISARRRLVVGDSKNRLNVSLSISPKKPHPNQPFCFSTGVTSKAGRPRAATLAMVLVPEPSWDTNEESHPLPKSQRGSPMLVMGVDGSGTGGACLQAPAQKGRFRLFALAAAAKGPAVGWTSKPVIIGGGVEVHVTAPTWVTAGDYACAEALLENHGAQAVYPKLRWKLEGLFGDGPLPKAVYLPAKSRVQVPVCFQMGAQKKGRVSLQVLGVEGSPQKEVEVNRRRIRPLRSYHRFGWLPPGGKTSVETLPCVRELQTTWAATPCFRLEAALSRLMKRNPKDLGTLTAAILSIASKESLPPSSLQRALTGPKGVQDPKSVLNTLVLQLLSLKRSDGSFRSHHHGPRAVLSMELAATEALLQAASLGVSTGQPIRARSIEWLRRVADSKIRRPGKAPIRERDRVEALYLLSQQGYPIAQKLREHTAKTEGRGLCTLARVLLLASRAQLKVNTLDALLGELRQRLEPLKNKKRLGRGSSLPSECLALTLEALDEALPGHELGRRVARHLWKRSRNGVWKDPLTTSRALRTLSAHFTRHPGPIPNSRVRVTLEEQTVMEAWFVGRHRETARYQVPPSWLFWPGSSSLRIEALGETPLFGHLQTRHSCYEKRGSTSKKPPRRPEISLSRLLEPPQNQEALTRGKQVQARLLVTATRDLEGGCIHEPLPGGLVPVKLGLLPGHHRMFPPLPGWWRDRRKGRLKVCFRNVKSGIYEIPYVVEAKHLGRYAAPPPLLSTWKNPVQILGAPWPSVRIYPRDKKPH